MEHTESLYATYASSLKQEIESREKRKEYGAKLREHIQEHGPLVVGGTPVASVGTFRKFNEKKFEKEHPELYEQYCTEVSYIKLKVPSG